MFWETEQAMEGCLTALDLREQFGRLSMVTMRGLEELPAEEVLPGTV